MLRAAMETDAAGILSRKAEPDEENRFFAMVKRRTDGEPLQYILGSQPFAGLDIICRPCALIPRPETEGLAELAADALPQGGSMLDLCAGTGCIGLAVKYARPDVNVTLSDIDPGCTALIKENAGKHSLEAEIICADLFAGVCGRRFDVIASNPPYIKSGDIEGLQTEVGFEPRLALDGGADGFVFYRRITALAYEYLSGGGMLAFEAGLGQTDGIAALMEKVGMTDISVKKDCFGAERFVCGRKKHEV